MKERSSGWLLFLTAGGFAVWALAFVVLYASLSVGCRFGWDNAPLIAGITVQRSQLVALFGLHLVAGAGLTLYLRKQRSSVTADGARNFLGSVAYFAAIAALISTLFTFAGVLFLSPCL